MTGFIALILTAELSGFLPSLPRTLARCKNGALRQLVNVQVRSDDAVDSEANSEYYDKYGDLVVTCMEGAGYQLDKRASAEFELQETKILHSTAAIAYGKYEAAQIESFWHRRWPWQGQQ